MFIKLVNVNPCTIEFQIQIVEHTMNLPEHTMNRPLICTDFSNEPC